MLLACQGISRLGPWTWDVRLSHVFRVTHHSFTLVPPLNFMGKGKESPLLPHAISDWVHAWRGSTMPQKLYTLLSLLKRLTIGPICATLAVIHFRDAWLKRGSHLRLQDVNFLGKTFGSPAAGTSRFTASMIKQSLPANANSAYGY